MVINQPGAIGDLIFLEPLFRHFWNKEGKKPTVVVHDHLMNLQPYFESATFVPVSHGLINVDDMEVRSDYLPLRFANQILRGYGPHDHHDLENMMEDKYRLIGLDPQMWTTIDLKFDERKADQLMFELDIKDSEPYALVNENSGVGAANIPIPLIVFIRMNPMSGYTVIDWYKVIMCAMENHHVSTSTFHLMQAIFNKHPHMCSKNYIYPRPNYDGLRGISQLKPTYQFTLMK